MSAISFYRQARRDGGIRTSITIDLDTVLHRYENGEKDSDPVLIWFVEVRCEGRRLPTEPESAREWFLNHAELIKVGLRASAEEFKAGIDFRSWPLERSISGPRGVRMHIVCSAVRRLEALDISRILLDIADHWVERIKALQEADAIVHWGLSYVEEDSRQDKRPRRDAAGNYNFARARMTQARCASEGSRHKP